MFFGHQRHRNALASYIDGQLPARESQALRRRLQSCKACRQELERLRGLLSALRDLPPVQAPRSFALTPEQASRPASGAPARVPPLALGMRLASAGVAVALAVLVVADLGGAGGGGQQRDEATERAQFAPASEGEGQEPDSAGALAPSPASPDMALARQPTPTPPAAEVEDATALGQDAETASPVPAQEEAAQDGDGGVDALRVAQIALAAGLVALLAGSVAITRLGRRNES